jgi:hypothetical protein
MRNQGRRIALDKRVRNVVGVNAAVDQLRNIVASEMHKTEPVT